MAMRTLNHGKSEFARSTAANDRTPSVYTPWPARWPGWVLVACVLEFGPHQTRVEVFIPCAVPPTNLASLARSRLHVRGVCSVQADEQKRVKSVLLMANTLEDFGLHSGALAAREMGGDLTVHSDGSGRGATFCLELPAANGN